MRKIAFVGMAALLAAGSLPAATRTWVGGTGNQTWGTASNWQDGAAPQAGDTVRFTKSVNFTAAVTLPANLTFNLDKGVIVKFTGVVSGAGGITRTGGSGELQLTNTGNTFDGPTKVTSSMIRFASLANIGAASSLGKPTTAEAATLDFNNVARLNGNGTYATDRPIVLGNSSQFFLDGTSQLTVNGPYSGKGYTRGTGTLIITPYLGEGSISNCSRTDKGTTQFTCTTNAFTCGISIADGFFRGATLANKGQPCAFGAGSTISMGQTDWSTTGTLCYNGATDATCDRDITVGGFTNSTPTANHHGGRFRNETKGTCLTLTGTLALNVRSNYPNTTPTLFLGGVGDGVFTAPLPGRMAFYKEDSGTWTLAGAHVASGPLFVKGGRLNIDGSVPADCTAPTKMTVEAGATLGGTGVVHGTTAVLAGGTLAAGAADRCGTLTFDGASVSLADGDRKSVV